MSRQLNGETVPDVGRGAGGERGSRRGRPRRHARDAEGAESYRGI